MLYYELWLCWPGKAIDVGILRGEDMAFYGRGVLFCTRVTLGLTTVTRTRTIQWAFLSNIVGPGTVWKSSTSLQACSHITCSQALAHHNQKSWYATSHINKYLTIWLDFVWYNHCKLRILLQSRHNNDAQIRRGRKKPSFEWTNYQGIVNL